MEYSNGAAEAYRYHPSSYDAFGGQTSAYCNGNGLPPASSDGSIHLGMTPTRRFHPYLVGGGTNGGDHSTLDLVQNGSELNGGGFALTGGQHHTCNQCGVSCDSPHSLAEHMQAHHFVFNESYPPPSVHIKTELNGGSASETAEILDLDSHKVHVYQPPGSVNLGTATIPFHHSVNGVGGGLGAPTPPYTPAASVGSASNSSSMGWMTPTPPLPTLAPPPPLHPQEYRPSTFPTYEIPAAPAVNGVVTNGNAIAPPVMKPANGWKPNPPAVGAPGSNHGGGSEARRPKTYNCEACNKWFTSSGHLKRHYNTTLHKNAVKSSGGSASTNGNGTATTTTADRRSTTPSSRSTATPLGANNSPAGSSDDKMIDDTSQPSPKAVAQSPNHVNSDYQVQQQHQPLMPSHQQQIQLQHSQVPSPLQPVSSPAYSTPLYPQQQQQQQQPQNHQLLDSYRSPYPPIPVSNSSGMQISSVSSPGPQSNHLSYNYCPSGTIAPNYQPTVYSQHHPVPQQQQQQQQQQHGYPQSNTMGYPPNSIAPPLSSNVNGQQLGVGPSASQREIVQQQQSNYHLNQEMQPFMTLNNNNIVDHHNKGGGEDLNSFAIKSQDSDCSDGLSEGSPIGSEDGDLEASDGEDVDQIVKLAPSIGGNFPSSNVVTASSKRNNGANNNSGGTAAAAAVGSFKCTQCDKAFNRVCYLTQHNNTFHKGDKPFKCHMCGKRFPNAELFDQHQQKHAGDKPYKCPLCPKQFNHKTDLRRHMCLHTGQKPFMCQVCNKGFIRKDHMVKHVQTHTRRNALHAQQPPSAPSL